MTSVKSYAYTTGEISGTPGTTSFSYSGDKLTSFGNKAITYNSNGGISSYDGWTYNWSNGRLSGLMKNIGSTARIPSNSSSKSYAFTYNAFGQRTGVSYNYFISPSDITPALDNEIISYNKEFGYDSAGRLIFETTAKTFHSGATSSVKIIFLYDENSMVGFEYITADGNNIYYYLRNLQGDVIAIYDSYGNKVVDYTYDAWGNCTIQSTTTNYTVAHANPIRYRGYYYDEDTGLYYLNARYYNPEWRRFISPDDSAYLDPETPNGLNLYAYCNNDPVNYVDPSGHSIILTTALILMGIGITAGIGYAAYNDYQDDSSINNSIGWQTYVGSAMIGGAIGFGLGYFGPTIASLLGSSFSFALPTLGTLNAGGALALSGSVTLTGAQIAGGALVAGLGIMLFARPNSGKIRYSDGTGKDPSTGKDFTDPNKAREYYKSINNPTEKAKWKRWLKGKGWIKNHLKGFFFASLSIEWLRYIFDESR